MDPVILRLRGGLHRVHQFPNGERQRSFSELRRPLGLAFVTKFGPEILIFNSIFLGGDRIDVGNDIAADMAGLAYVAGYTASTNFPVTSNAVSLGTLATRTFL